jgi:hypothetical protein
MLYRKWLITFAFFLALGVAGCTASNDDDDGQPYSSDDDTAPADDDVSDDDDVTWIDPDTLLEWQDPPSEEGLNWYEATAYCDALELAGHDDWRLPTISELRTLIVGCPETMTGGECGVTDECTNAETCRGQECWFICQNGAGPTGGCFQRASLSGACGSYWSATTGPDYGDQYEADFAAWCVGFAWANISTGNPAKSYGSNPEDPINARCVR